MDFGETPALGPGFVIFCRTYFAYGSITCVRS